MSDRTHDENGEPRGRDEAIGAHMDRLATPDHGESFWEDLRAGIARTPGAAPAGAEGDPGASEPTRVGSGRPPEPTRVVPLGQPVPEAEYGLRRARRARRVLAVAAVVVLVAVAAAVVAVVVEDDEPDEAITAGPDPTTEPTTDPTPGPTSEPTPDVAPPTIDEPGDDGSETFVDWTTAVDSTVIGPGRLVAASPDGRWLYVADRDPDGGSGCEGAERQTLFVVDVATGERRPADAGLSDATGGIEMVFDASGTRAAVLEQCEGFASRLAVVGLGGNGAFTAPSQIPPERFGQAVSDIAWAADGSLLVAAVTFGPVNDEPGDQRRLFRIDTDAGESTEVLGEDVVVFAERGDGEIIAGTTTGVRVPDARVIDRATPFEIRMSPDGTLAALQGPGIVEIIDVTTGDVVSATASDGDATGAGVWTPDGTYLAGFVQLDTVTSTQLVAIDPTGGREPANVTGGLDFAGVAVVTDDTIAYSKWVDDLGNSEVYLTTFERRAAETPPSDGGVVATSIEEIADATLPTTLIDEGEVTLTDGAFFRGAPGDAQFAEVTVRTPVSTVDVDRDGTPDAFVVLDGGFGGTGIFSDLVVLLARDDGFVVASEPIRLGADVRIEGPVALSGRPGVGFVFDTRAEGTPQLEFDIRRTLVLQADVDDVVTVTDAVVTVTDTVDEPIGG